MGPSVSASPAGKYAAKTIFAAVFLRAPGMGDNLVVKVHYGLGSRNR